MSCRARIVLFILALTTPTLATAQNHEGPPGHDPSRTVPATSLPAASLAPSPAGAALLPHRSPLLGPAEVDPHGPPPTRLAAGESDADLWVTAAVLAGASLAGLWAGYQAPLPAADDDSRLSVWHLLTSPMASVVTVTAAAMLMGESGPSSLRGSLLGAGAGLGAALLASLSTGDSSIVITYAGVHGLVSALTTR